MLFMIHVIFLPSCLMMLKMALVRTCADGISTIVGESGNACLSEDNVTVIAVKFASFLSTGCLKAVRSGASSFPPLSLFAS